MNITQYLVNNGTASDAEEAKEMYQGILEDIDAIMSTGEHFDLEEYLIEEGIEPDYALDVLSDLQNLPIKSKPSLTD